jgi:tRNA-2-methylthio-N6-dimethylallyladenosine synthase
MPRFHLVTFGCQMNVHDSERISEVLRAAGYAATEDVEQADLVLLNTCTVREKAEQKLRSEVGRLGIVKRRRPGMTIAVCGCVAQQEGEALLRHVPEIDLVLGPDNIPELPGLLAELELGGPPRARTVFDLQQPRFLRASPIPGQQAPSAFVTVMKGCDERCTYCIVPTTRGPERYRPATEILQEVASLVEAGALEITLLGQTVNSYRDPAGGLAAPPGAGESPWSQTHPSRLHDDESEFASLLRRIAAEVPALRRLRYTSPHPRHLTMSLIRAHLPVQSGSDAVLRRMLRRYSCAEFLERVEALRQAVPGSMTLSTDMIVGFPGETEADFEDTLELVRRVGFTGLFGFKYSPRRGTPALKLGDDISEEDKSRRLTRLFELAAEQRRHHLTSLVGTEQSVLIEGRGDDGRLQGRAERSEIVHVEGPDALFGRLLTVRITEAFNNSLAAVVAETGLLSRLAVASPPSSTGRDSGPEAASPGKRSLPLITG